MLVFAHLAFNFQGQNGKEVSRPSHQILEEKTVQKASVLYD